MEDYLSEFISNFEGRVQKKVIKLLRKRISQCRPEYLSSSDLFNTVLITQAKINTDNKNIYVHLKEFLEEIKRHKKEEGRSNDKPANTKTTENSKPCDSDITSTKDVNKVNNIVEKNRKINGRKDFITSSADELSNNKEKNSKIVVGGAPRTFDDCFRKFAACNDTCSSDSDSVTSVTSSQEEVNTESVTSVVSSQEEVNTESVTSVVSSQEEVNTESVTSVVSSQEEVDTELSDVEFIIEQDDTRPSSSCSVDTKDVHKLSSSFTVFEGSCDGSVTSDKSADIQEGEDVTMVTEELSEVEEDVTMVTEDSSEEEEEDFDKEEEMPCQPVCSPDSQGMELIGTDKDGSCELLYEVQVNFVDDEAIVLSPDSVDETDVVVPNDYKVKDKHDTKKHDKEPVFKSDLCEDKSKTSKLTTTEEVVSMNVDIKNDGDTETKLPNLNSVVQKLKKEGRKYLSLKLPKSVNCETMKDSSMNLPESAQREQDDKDQGGQDDKHERGHNKKYEGGQSDQNEGGQSNKDEGVQSDKDELEQSNKETGGQNDKDEGQSDKNEGQSDKNEGGESAKDEIERSDKDELELSDKDTGGQSDKNEGGQSVKDEIEQSNKDELELSDKDELELSDKDTGGQNDKNEGRQSVKDEIKQSNKDELELSDKDELELSDKDTGGQSNKHEGRQSDKNEGQSDKDEGGQSDKDEGGQSDKDEGGQSDKDEGGQIDKYKGQSDKDEEMSESFSLRSADKCVDIKRCDQKIYERDNKSPDVENNTDISREKLREECPTHNTEVEMAVVTDSVQSTSSGAMYAPGEITEEKHETKEKKKGSKSQIRRLEKLLEDIKNKIEELKQKEISLDEMEDDESAYIMEDRYQKKFVKVWNKLCEVKGRPSKTGRPSEKKFAYSGTRYPEINRKIESFINKTQKFPDFHDIRQVIAKVNHRCKLGMRSSAIDKEAREVFTDVGDKLQRRRQDDLLVTFRGHLTNTSDLSSARDPATADNELKKKLDDSRKVGLRKLNEVMEKYVSKQYDKEKEEECSSANDNNTQSDDDNTQSDDNSQSDDENIEIPEIARIMNDTGTDRKSEEKEVTNKSTSSDKKQVQSDRKESKGSLKIGQSQCRAIDKDVIGRGDPKRVVPHTQDNKNTSRGITDNREKSKIWQQGQNVALDKKLGNKSLSLSKCKLDQVIQRTQSDKEFGRKPSSLNSCQSNTKIHNTSSSKSVALSKLQNAGSSKPVVLSESSSTGSSKPVVPIKLHNTGSSKPVVPIKLHSTGSSKPVVLGASSEDDSDIEVISVDIVHPYVSEPKLKTIAGNKRPADLQKPQDRVSKRLKTENIIKEKRQLVNCSMNPGALPVQKITKPSVIVPTKYKTASSTEIKNPLTFRGNQGHNVHVSQNMQSAYSASHTIHTASPRTDLMLKFQKSSPKSIPNVYRGLKLARQKEIKRRETKYDAGQGENVVTSSVPSDDDVIVLD